MTLIIKLLKSVYWGGYNIYYKTLTRVSPRLNTIVKYYEKFHAFPNLSNPTSFNERLLKLKLEQYNKSPLVKQCADKYAVRKYVTDKGLAKLLVPLIAVYDKPEDIEWDKLPDRFVLKWNFGCHLNIICKEKSSFDENQAISTLKKWKHSTNHLLHSEMQYEIPSRRKKIIVEEFLDNGTGESPEDTKIYCYNGRPLYIMICYDRKESGAAKYIYFDRNWIFQPFDKENQKLPIGFNSSKPKILDELLEYAGILSKGFPFVRVDFYVINDKIYLGELTFTPCGCMDQAITPEANQILGKPIGM